jgi:hypothetical protein
VKAKRLVENVQRAGLPNVTDAVWRRSRAEATSAGRASRAPKTHRHAAYKEVPEVTRSSQRKRVNSREGVTATLIVAMFTEETPWLKGRDLDSVMGRAVCDWLGWNLSG